MQVLPNIFANVPSNAAGLPRGIYIFDFQIIISCSTLTRLCYLFFREAISHAHTTKFIVLFELLVTLVAISFFDNSFDVPYHYPLPRNLPRRNV